MQIGDVLGRGEDEIAILSLLALLGREARSKGGAVFQVHFNCLFIDLSVKPHYPIIFLLESY